MEFEVLETGSDGRTAPGGAPTLVLLPALFAGRWIWEACLEAFVSRYRVVVFDRPFATHSADEASIDAMSARVLEALSALRVPAAALLANSIGALVALDLAVRDSRVRAAVLSGAPATPGREQPLTSLQGRITDRDRRAVVERMFFDDRFSTDPRVQAAAAVTKDRCAARFTTRALRSARSVDVEQLVATVTCPLYFIWGREDAISPLSEWSGTFERHVPPERVCVLPECGHSPMIEKPREYASAVISYLAEAGF